MQVARDQQSAAGRRMVHASAASTEFQHHLANGREQPAKRRLLGNHVVSEYGSLFDPPAEPNCNRSQPLHRALSSPGPREAVSQASPRTLASDGTSPSGSPGFGLPRGSLRTVRSSRASRLGAKRMLRKVPPAFGFNLKRHGASRPVTTGNFSIHHRTARAVPLKAGAIRPTPADKSVIC
jgi:hypothetical protein